MYHLHLTVLLSRILDNCDLYYIFYFTISIGLMYRWHRINKSIASVDITMLFSKMNRCFSYIKECYDLCEVIVKF